MYIGCSNVDTRTYNESRGWQNQSAAPFYVLILFIMTGYYNKSLDKWWLEGQGTLERENDLPLYGTITVKDALKFGYKAKEYEVTVDEPTVVIHAETEEEKTHAAILTRMAEIRQTLDEMDYLTSKEIDGEDMSEYGDYKEERKALRVEYRELETKLKEEE